MNLNDFYRLGEAARRRRVLDEKYKRLAEEKAKKIEEERIAKEAQKQEVVNRAIHKEESTREVIKPIQKSKEIEELQRIMSIPQIFCAPSQVISVESLESPKIKGILAKK